MVANQRPVRWHSELALISEDIVNGPKGNFDSLLRLQFATHFE